MKKLLPLQRDLIHITAALSIFRFSMTMSGVFIPFIILQRGADLWVVAAFFTAYAAIKLPINYPIMLVIQRYGAHLGLGIGFGAAALQLASILGFSISGNSAFLFISALSIAIANSFIWNSQHLHISRVMDSTTKSSSIASMEIVSRMLEITGPLIGGAVGMYFGSGALLAVSLSVLMLSIIPLKNMGRLKTDSSNQKIKFSLGGAPPRDLFANFCFNVEAAIGMALWPIYLAIIVKTFGGIGIIAALGAVATLVTTWIAGHRGDKGRDRAVLVQGAFVSSIAHTLRLFATTPVFVGAVTSLYNASFAYLQNAWVSNYYGNAKRRGIQYIMSMEIACDAAYLFLWGGLLTVLLISGDQSLFFGVAFVAAAIAAWGCLAISKQGTLATTTDLK